MSPRKTIFRFFLTYLCVLLPMLALNFSAQRVVLVQAQHRTDEGVVWQLQQVALELESLKERCEDYTVRLGTSDIMRARRVLDDRDPATSDGDDDEARHLLDVPAVDRRDGHVVVDDDDAQPVVRGAHRAPAATGVAGAPSSSG